ncbi:MAG TPA: hypothetical protein PL033_18380 [Candidatus Brocadiia bacterium]|nr:hypothetical protein [Candidatus Brocadiia bacterium]
MRATVGWALAPALANGAAMILAAIVGQTAVAETFEHIGQPCRGFQVLAGRCVKDRKSDREWFVLTNMNETSGAELIFIDTVKNEGAVYQAPAGAGSWALNEVPGDRLVVGTYYDGVFMIFDLNQMKFVKVAKFEGESYIWNLAMGGDGRLYGGTYPGGKLGALDLTTYAVEDCGAPAPPNLYLRQVSSMADGRLLCSLGTEKPVMLIYDPVTKKFSDVPEQIKGAATGCVWDGYFIAGSRVCKGPELTVVDPPPFPTPPKDKGAWYVDSYMSGNGLLVLRQGNAIYLFRKGDKELTFVSDIDLRGGRTLACNSRNEVLGVRGQEYFVLKPGDATLNLIPIPAQSGPRPTLFLRADGRGRIWGGPHFGQTLFWIAPKTGKTVNTSVVCDSGGEVYDATFVNGVAYAAAYAGGDIVRYNPDEAWDQWNGKNPRTIARVSPAYIRPTGGIVTGPDGRLYSGWMAKYGAYGGAIAITIPDTGENILIENPLGEQAISGVDTDGKSIFAGTCVGANGLPDKKGEPVRFGVINAATKEVTFRKEFPDEGRVGPVIRDVKTGLVVIAAGGDILIFDPVKNEFVEPASDDVPGVGSYKFAGNGKGLVFYGSGKDVMELNLETKQFRQMTELPDNVTNVTVDENGTVYASCGNDVYRLK